LIRGRGKVLKRGADAPLKHPHIINPEQGELKRGEASLLILFPLSLIRRGGHRG